VNSFIIRFSVESVIWYLGVSEFTKVLFVLSLILKNCQEKS